MNLDEIIKKILEVANYPAGKREEFVSTFYRYLSVRILKSIEKVNEEAFQKLNEETVKDMSPEDLKKLWAEVSQDQQVKYKIDKTVDVVLTEIVDDIVDAADDEQKQQILASLPSG